MAGAFRGATTHRREHEGVGTRPGALAAVMAKSCDSRPTASTGRPTCSAASWRSTPPSCSCARSRPGPAIATIPVTNWGAGHEPRPGTRSRRRRPRPPLPDASGRRRASVVLTHRAHHGAGPPPWRSQRQRRPSRPHLPCGPPQPRPPCASSAWHRRDCRRSARRTARPCGSVSPVKGVPDPNGVQPHSGLMGARLVTPCCPPLYRPEPIPCLQRRGHRGHTSGQGGPAGR